MQRTLGLIVLVALVVVASFFLIKATQPEETATNAATRLFSYPNLSSTELITLEFPGYRVRVEGWDGVGVDVEVVGKIIAPINIVTEANVIRMVSGELKAPLWEPAFRVRVQRQTPVAIQAGEVWVRDCTVANLDVRRAHVRDASLPLPLQQKLRGNQRGWQTVNF